MVFSIKLASCPYFLICPHQSGSVDNNPGDFSSGLLPATKLQLLKKFKVYLLNQFPSALGVILQLRFGAFIRKPIESHSGSDEDLYT